jgi:hypothetical protein
MKQLIFTLIICSIATGLFAQNTTDTAKTKKGVSIKLGYGEDASSININKNRDTTVHQHSRAPGFSWGFTFSRFDLGLATLVDNGSFTLSPQNEFLRYRSWKTSNVGFDVIQFGYRFDSSFKMYLSGGFDWTLIRLRDNITILENQPVLTYRQDNIDYSKNRFSSTYLRIPLSFEFRTKDDYDGGSFRFVFGPEGGVLLGGRVKQISDENGKQKFDNDYHFTRFRYGPFLRVTYAGFGIFAKYYMNNMFENSPAQDGLKNFSFGMTFDL